MKLSRHKFVRRLLNYYRTHFDIDVPFVILIDGTFTFEALQWKIQIDEQLKAYLETDQIKCSTTLCAIKETELLGGIAFGAMLILKQYDIVKCDHYPCISAEKCFEQVLIKDKTKQYFLASQSSSLRDYSHFHRPDLPTMLITHNAINLERPTLTSRSIVEEQKKERLKICPMLTLFLLAIHSAKVTIPIVSLYASAPTFFTLWSCLRLITLLAFPQHVYRRCDDHLYSMYQRFVLFYFQNWVNVKIYLHGDYEDMLKNKENVLYLSNHQSSVDWIVANMLAVHQGSLGHIRYVLKNELKYIPFYGFYFQQHGCIYVRRSDKGDLNRVERGMQQIASSGLPVWLVIFPEGTRYNPVSNQHAIQRSKTFAQEKGLSPLEYVLYPRSGATVAAIKTLKDQLDAVYDVTLMYNQTYDDDQRIRLAAPSMSEYLQGQTSELHIDIRRIAMNDIPKESDEEISHWLYQRFQIKDRLLKTFYDFQANSKMESDIFRSDSNDQPLEMELPLRETIYSCLFFTLTTIPFVLSERGRSMYCKLCLFAPPLTLLWMHFFSSSLKTGM